MPDECENPTTPRIVDTVLSLKTVASVIVIIVSISAAFFTYDTRITLLESEVKDHIAISAELRLQDDAINQLQSDLASMSVRLDLDEQQLSKVNELSRELERVSDVQAERVIWAQRELEKIKAKLSRIQ